ncbi:MAG: polysaccharide deacetylase family protein [Oscillospiraceae bacterium]|nr:polysaccharide deacetylase family protein [Oscillospiraceae bacterium]
MENNNKTSLKGRGWLVFLPGLLLVAAAICVALIIIGLKNGSNPTLQDGLTNNPLQSSMYNSVPTMQQDNAAQSSGTGQAAATVLPSSKVITTNISSASGATFTGFAPLPELPLKVEKPEDIPKLPTKRIEHSYGVSSGGKPHQISIDFQKFFESKGYKAFALDTKATDKRLYLTFDIGYENGVTSKILDILKEKKVPAAFFATQHHLKTNPELAARMITDGHIVGNHSVTHPDFSIISRAKMIEEIQGFDNYLRKNFGYTAPYFRFPSGAYNENALELVQSLGFTSVFWSASWADWDTGKQQGKQKAFDTITSRLHPGAVILLHAVSTDNAAALSDIIDWARTQGCEFRALTEYGK